MGAFGGPHLPQNDSLLFSYDTGNTYKSWKGMPTTNLKVNGNGDFSNGVTDWTVTSGVSTEVLPKFKGARNVLKLTRTANVAGYNGIRSTGITVSPSTWYTFSMRIFVPAAMQQMIRLYVGERVDTTILNWRVVQTNSASPGGTWQILQSSFQTGATANNFAQAPYLDWNTTASTVDEVVYIDWYQVEQNSFATPFVDGTRSNTQALVDMAGGNTITANSVTYSASDMEYTNAGADYATITDFSYPANYSTDPFSIEAWTFCATGDVWYDSVSFSSNSGTPIVGRGSYVGSHGLLRNPTTDRISFLLRTDASLYYADVSSLARDTWHHIVGTWDGTNNKIYHNGEYITQNTPTWTTPTTGVSGNWRINGNMAFGGNNGGYADGKHDVVRIYDVALTASEVKRNYNANKARFGV